MKIEQMEHLNDFLEMESLSSDFIPPDPASELKNRLKKVDTNLVYNSSGDLSEDYNLARTTLSNLIETGTESLMDLVRHTKEDPTARSFEVTASMIKTIADVSKDLLSLQKQMKDISMPSQIKSDEYSNGENQQNYDISPKDILDIIKQNKHNIV